MLNRALVVPASLGSTLFPAFSSLQAVGALDKLEDFYSRSLKYLVVVMGPPLLLAGAFSQDILNAWLGPVFAQNGAIPLRILAVSILLSSIALIPYGLLQGAGRPDLTAIFHLLELPVHLALVWLLVSRYGLIGAALAVTIRVGIDTGLILWACDKVGLGSFRSVRQTGVTKSLLGLILVAVVLSFPHVAAGSLPRRLSVAGLLCFGYLVVQWYWSFDDRDRTFAVNTIGHFGVRRTPTPKSETPPAPSRAST
jgi:O-antigen/teichoic acid export membrane protein